MQLSRFAFAALFLLAGPALADSRSPDLATPLPPIQVAPSHVFAVPTGPAGGVMGSAQYNSPGLSVGGTVNVAPNGGAGGTILFTFPNPLSR